MTTMRFQIDPLLDGVTNMERDAELLARAEGGEAACRVYGWERPWVSLGRFQSADRDLVAPDRIPWVMRPTGGKAVLHGHDVTVGLATSLSGIGCGPRELKKAYRHLIAPIVDALRACGLPATMAGGTRHESQGIRTSDCFAFNSSNDVVDERTGQKLCGCALRLTENAVLLQASIPYREPDIAPASVIREATDTKIQAWHSASFAQTLEQALRYNLQHVPA